MPDLQIEYVRPDQLVEAPWNPRTIRRDALRRLAELLDAHGFAQPIVARRRDGMVLGGHQRLRANRLRKTPETRVPVVFLDGICDRRAKALNIALNNDQAQGRFEPERLAELVAQLDDDLEALSEQTAFSRTQLQALAQQVGPPDPLQPSVLERRGEQIGPEKVVIVLEAGEEDFDDLREQIDAWVRDGRVCCHIRLPQREAGR
jgi:ParB-like chromosome segregation protein Spo0J